MLELEAWRKEVGPMLRQLQEDQAYRARWKEERSKKWSRWQRGIVAVTGILGAGAVVVAAIIQLAHLL